MTLAHPCARRRNYECHNSRMETTNMLQMTDHTILAWLEEIGTPGFGARTWHIETLKGGMSSRGHSRAMCSNIQYPFISTTTTLRDCTTSISELCRSCGWEFLEPDTTKHGKAELSERIADGASRLKHIVEHTHKMTEEKSIAPNLHRLLMAHNISQMGGSLTEQIHPALDIAKTFTTTTLTNVAKQYPTDIPATITEMVLLGAKMATKNDIVPFRYRVLSTAQTYEQEDLFPAWLDKILILDEYTQAGIAMRGDTKHAAVLNSLTRANGNDSIDLWEKTFAKHAARQKTFIFAAAGLNSLIDKYAVCLAEIALLLGLKVRRGTVGYGELPELALTWLISLAGRDKIRVWAVEPKEQPISNRQYDEALTLWSENVQVLDSIYCDPKNAFHAATLL